jgi:hypothetical protein
MKALVLLGCLGCVAAVRPDRELMREIAFAQEAHAAAQGDDFARAVANRATDDVDEAMKEASRGDNAAAWRSLARAHADSELALSLAREARERRAASRMNAALTAALEGP